MLSPMKTEQGESGSQRDKQNQLGPLPGLRRRTSFGLPTGDDRRLPGPLHRGDEARIWVDGLPLPPHFFRPQLEDCKMQVRRARIRIARRSHKPDDVSTRDLHSLPQPFRIPVQVRIVVAIRALFVKLVDCVAARVSFHPASKVVRASGTYWAGAGIRLVAGVGFEPTTFGL